MRVKCIEATEQAAGRPLTAREVQGIEDRVRLNLRLLAIRDQQTFLAMTPPERLRAAAQMAANQLLHEVNKKAQRVALTIQAHDRLEAHMQSYPGPKVDALEHAIVFVADGKSNVISAESRGNAVRANALRQLMDAFEAVDPRFFGFFENVEGVHQLTKAIFGEGGDAKAKAGANAWAEVTGALRQHFNDAGGNVGLLEDFRIPQHHSQLKAAKAGREKWVRDTLPLLDRRKYVRPDGAQMTDAEVTTFLEHAWETIATGGVNKGEGAAQGSGMRANRGSEHRQIHYANADAYLEYQGMYGERDLFSVMVGHVSQVARDIAMVETFGPNPDLAFQVFRDKAVKADALANPKKSGRAQERGTRLEGLYNFVAGYDLPVASEWLAHGFDTLRNWLVASRLGSAVITSFSDEATLYLTAHVNKLPEAQLFRNELAALNPADKVELRMARRAGLALETLIGDLNRFGQEGLGRTFSSKVANTTMRLSGLNALTDARKRAFGVTMMDAIGALTREHSTIAGLDAVDHKILLSKGVTETDWTVWRTAVPEAWNGNATMLTPDAIARVDPEALVGTVKGITSTKQAERAVREAVHKLLAVVLEETNMAVITPGARERAMIGGTLQRGSWKGELVRSFFLFKSFPIAMISRHWMRGNGMETAGGKAAYIASLVVGTTIMGALSMEVDQLLQGKDPRNLNPFEGQHGAKNWMAAMLKGGSLGIYGDFLFSEATQGSNRTPLATVQGPVFSLVEEAIGLTQGNVVQAMQGKETNAGAEAVKFVKGNTPGANLWYAKAALDHMVFQQLQEYFSPGYLSTVRQRAQREFGQSFYWAPGAPINEARPPDLGKAAGG